MDRKCERGQGENDMDMASGQGSYRTLGRVKEKANNRYSKKKNNCSTVRPHKEGQAQHPHHINNSHSITWLQDIQRHHWLVKKHWENHITTQNHSSYYIGWVPNAGSSSPSQVTYCQQKVRCTWEYQQHNYKVVIYWVMHPLLHWVNLQTFTTLFQCTTLGIYIRSYGQYASEFD